VIVYESERLLLRTLTETDLDLLAAIFADPDVTRYIGGPRTREEVRARLEQLIAAYERDGFSKWAVVLRATGETIGRCGPMREAIEGRDEVEIGYDLAKEHWGRGIASEAAGAALTYCFDVLRLPRVISLIAPGNAASLGVARRLGMRHERDVTWRGTRFGLHSVERDASR
jgi:ribosomal-protein-alanine N-acetyltransferase